MSDPGGKVRLIKPCLISDIGAGVAIAALILLLDLASNSLHGALFHIEDRKEIVADVLGWGFGFVLGRRTLRSHPTDTQGNG